MLYILSELVSGTVFYFAVLTLRIRITSAPMNCFVLLSQLVANSVTHGLIAFMAELDTISRVVLKIILTACGFWNLDFFRYFIPPFCLSQGLKNIHILALQYVSAFYPLLLIALTYACVGTTSDQLSGYGNHFTDVALMLESSWKQKHRCLCHISSSVLL